MSKNLSPDYLGGIPARPSTLVPGVALLHLPTPDAKISIRRFQVSPNDPSFPSSTSDNVLQRLRSDPLDAAWRTINGYYQGDRDVRNILESPCCVVAAAVKRDENSTETSPASSASPRILWCFEIVSSKQSPLDKLVTELHGLQEIEPRLDSIVSTLVLNCSEHGRTLKCLERNCSDQTICRVMLEPLGHQKSAWDHFQAAVVEKIAWRGGRRLSAGSGLSFAFPPSISSRITPYSTDKLLLEVIRRRMPQCLPSSPKSQLRPMMLSSVNLPALILGPQVLTASQESQLLSVFETTMGSTWKHGQTEGKLAARVVGRQFADWSTYWVPLIPADKLSLDHISKTSPDLLIKEWQKYQGVITIWPTHFVHNLIPSTRWDSNMSRHAETPEGLSNTDILNDAASIFDLMTNFQEPTVIEDSDAIDDMYEESMDGNEMELDQPLAPIDSDNDLFSSHSRSPDAQDEVDSLFDLSRPVSPLDSTPQAPQAQQESRSQVREDTSPTWPTIPDRASYPEEIVEESALRVTEDDFDFFDSPAHTSMEIDRPLAAILESSEVLEPPEEKAEPNLEPPNPVAPEVPGPLSLESTEIAPQTNLIAFSTPAAEAQELAMVPVSVNETEHIPKPRTIPPGIDIIPLTFEPVTLPQSRSPLASYQYSFPSPAPTPEALRPELYERLKPKVATYDYAATWEEESDSSDDDGMETYTTGAPPTPESEMDYSYSPSRATTPAETETKQMDHEVRHAGVIALGSEWVVLKGDPNLASTYRKPWNPSWSGSSESPEPKVRPNGDVQDETWKGVGLDRLSNEIVFNSRFRAFLSSSFSETVPSRTGSASSLISEMPLCDLVRSDSLVIPSVDVAYGGKVLQVSIAATRYWKELGVEPVGGRKDVSAYILCDMKASTSAGTILQKLGNEYESSLLGRHLPGQAAGAEGGVLRAAMTDWSKTIAAVQGMEDGLVVIYLLLPTSTSPSASVLKSLLSVRLNPLVVTHLLPPSPTITSDIVFDVYTRSAVRFEKVLLRGRPLEDSTPLYAKPSRFTIAHDSVRQPILTLQWPIKSSDVLNYKRLLHCAYGWDLDLGLMVAYFVDADGDEYGVKTWLLDGELANLEPRLRTVWQYFAEAAQKAAGEWRLVVCSWGIMSLEEMSCWDSIIKPRFETHVILMVESKASQVDRSIQIPRQIISNVNTATLNDPSTMMVDDTLTAHGGSFQKRIPVSIPRTSTPTSEKDYVSAYPDTSFIFSITSPSTLHHRSTMYHTVARRIVPNLEQLDDLKFNIESGLTIDLYRLVCLARRRHGFKDTELPLHLEGVRSVLECVRKLAGKVDGAS